MARLSHIAMVIIALGCLAATCCHQPVVPLPPLIPESVTGPHVRVGNVRVYNTGMESVGPAGSGVVIGHHNARTYILTAKHSTNLVEPNKRCTYRLGVWTDETSHPIDLRIEKRAPHGLDAAIISTRAFTHPVARISQRNPAQREQVFVLGSPDGSFRTVYRRRVSRFAGRVRGRLQHQLRAFVLDEELLHGFSGGGVYNGHEELVGMCYAISGDEYHRGICIPIDTLRSFIQPYIR